MNASCLSCERAKKISFQRKNTDGKTASNILKGIHVTDTAIQAAVSEFAEITSLKSIYFFNWFQKIKMFFRHF